MYCNNKTLRLKKLLKFYKTQAVAATRTAAVEDNTTREVKPAIATSSLQYPLNQKNREQRFSKCLEIFTNYFPENVILKLNEIEKNLAEDKTTKKI